MSGDFWHHMGFMLVTFVVFLLPGLASRRMARSDYVTLVVLASVTFFAAIVPGIVRFGFDKNSATYVLAALMVIAIATLNRSVPSRAADSAD